MFPINLPNVLTMLRILLVPVLLVILLDASPGESGSWLAAGVFALAAVTDGLDGYLARSRGSITNFGKVMDPIADKLMIAAALLALIQLERLAAWVAMVIIAREFAVTVLRATAGAQGVVIPASPLGKIKTTVQIATVFTLIAVNDTGMWWVQALVYLTVLITLVSGADYFLNFRRRIDEARHRVTDDTADVVTRQQSAQAP